MTTCFSQTRGHLINRMVTLKRTVWYAVLFIARHIMLDGELLRETYECIFK